MSIRIRKTKKGLRFDAVISKTISGGKRKRIIRTFKSQNQAQKFFSDQKNKINRQGLASVDDFIFDADISFASAFKTWALKYKNPHVVNSTQANINNTFIHIKKMFKNIKLIDIRPSMIQRFFDIQGQHYSKETVNKRKSHISLFFKFCIDEGLINKNPVANVILTARDDLKRPEDQKVYSIKDLRTLHDYLMNKTDLTGAERIILLMSETGMRSAEARALTLDRIDFANSLLKIDRSWDSIDHCFKPTKNRKCRYVTISDNLKNKIQSFHLFSEDFIGTNREGYPMSTNAINKRLRYLADDLKISVRTSHALRRSYASLLFEQGIEITAVSELLGHSSIQVTENFYLKLFPENRNKANIQVKKLFNNF
ncbi:MAG: tyrosine-type recombinase/integrase [Oenococcus oeni]